MYSIYKIEHRTNPDLVYVGSTKNFNQRKSQHKLNCSLNNEKVYQMIREHGGWDEFDMVEIKQIECTQLEAREEEDRIRIELNARMNMRSPVLDIENQKKTIQKYQQAHREERNQKSREYQQAHREERNQKSREYQQAHREERNQKSREYRQEHREELLQKNKEPYTCECGSQITRSGKTMHLRTQKHIMWASI